MQKIFYKTKTFCRNLKEHFAKCNVTTTVLKRVWITAKSYFWLRLSVRLSVNMEQLSPYWTDFHEI